MIYRLRAHVRLEKQRVNESNHYLDLPSLQQLVSLRKPLSSASPGGQGQAKHQKDLLDLKIFIDTDDDIRLLRRMERNIQERGRDFDSIKAQYLTTVKPMHDAFVQPSRQPADIIVPRGRKCYGARPYPFQS